MRERRPMSIEWLSPEWGVPPTVRAVCTLRSGGVSAAPFASLNLATGVGDEPAAVAENRRRLRAALALPAEPLWLQQSHGVTVVAADAEAAPGPADAAVTSQDDRVLAIMVADCMPVLFASDDGAVIGAAHAGWRGLASGVLEATVEAMGVDPRRVHAWLGPAIGPRHFEVGAEVRAQFLAGDARAAAGFTANARGRWQCDLALLAKQRLARLGLKQLSAVQRCTYADAAGCYSYRRDGQTGRMAALIWRRGGGPRGAC
jgi:YfiH family protein